MIRVTVELLSAVTKETTTLGVMEITNDGTGDFKLRNYDGRAAAPELDGAGDFEGKVMRKPDFNIATRVGRVNKHRAQAEVIWVLIGKMLTSMGYVK